MHRRANPSESGPSTEWEERTIVGTDGLAVPFHIGQNWAWDAYTRFVAIVSGTQGGKTSFGPWWLAREIYGDWIFQKDPKDPTYFEGKGSGDYLAVTASFDLFKLKMLPTIRQVFEEILGVGRYWPSSKILELKDPSTGEFWAVNADDPMWGRVILRSASSDGGLESASAKAAWLDEAGQDDFDVMAWRAVIRRNALYSARILITTTLYNLGWVKQEIIDKALSGGKVEVLHTDTAVAERTINEVGGVTLVQFDSIMNPAYPKERYDEAEASLPPDEFAMQYRGRIQGLRGMIYDCHDAKLNQVPRFPIPKHWMRYLGADFGGVNTAAVLVAEEPGTGRLFAYREYLAGSRTAAEHAAKILEEETGVPYGYGGAKSEGQWRLEMSVGGLPLSEPMVSDVNVGILRVYAQIKGRQLIFFDDLVGILDEIGRYRYKRDRAGDPTKEIENKAKFHRLDALRYVISSIRDETSWAVGASAG